MSAQEFHDKGNKAFQSQDWPDAIKFYTSALAFEKKPTLYSSRSAAYLKNEEDEKALEDAEACIKLDPTFAKGYSRKGTTLVAMKKYDDAILAYKDGLKACPDNEGLSKGLAATKRAQLGFNETTKAATQAARRGQASFRASLARKQKATQAEGVTEFVKESRKAIQLQIAQLQAHLSLLDSLAEMGDEEKMEMLFVVLDQDEDGSIDARELAEAIRKRNADMNFAESLDRAINMVAVFDGDGDAKLSFEEFKDMIMTLTQEMGSSFHEFAEFLILQMLLLEGNEPMEQLAGAMISPEINQEVAARKDLINALVDPRLVQLFKLFDNSGDGVLSFKEVAVGLYQLTKDMEGSIKATVELLLALDKNDDRCLDYEQFVRFILGFCAAAESSFDDMADGLILLLSNDCIVMTEEELAGLYITDEYYSAAKDLEAAVKEEVEVQNLLSYGRLFKLFDLIDENKDGGIDAKELASGLKKFHASMGIESDAELESVLLVVGGTNASGEISMNKEDFARAMVLYASSLDIDVNELVDFMCVTSLLDSAEVGYDTAIRQSVAGDMLKYDVLLLELDEEDLALE